VPIKQLFLGSLILP